MSITFDNPHALWLIGAIPLYWWWLKRRTITAAVRYPSVRNLKRLPRSFRQRCRFVMGLARTAAMLLLIVVLARPMRQLETQELPSEGIAIAMLVDRSGSMGNPQGKLMYEGKLALRFEVARNVLRDFVVGQGDELSGRPNDLIGLFTFATYPRNDHPFSLDHTSLQNVAGRLLAEKSFLDQYGQPTDDIKKAAMQTDEQGRVLRDRFGRTAPRSNPLQFTDLKKAIEYTADKLILLEEDIDRSSEGLRTYTLKNTVAVLLPDGEPTVGSRGRGADYPDDATIEKLTEAGIRVYYIQILSHERYRERPDGTVEVIVPQSGRLFGSLQARQEAEQVNEAIEQARRLSRLTDGEHFLATSGDQIKDIYARIDELERSDVGGRTVLSHEERYRVYLLTALMLLAGETILGLTWLRRAP